MNTVSRTAARLALCSFVVGASAACTKADAPAPPTAPADAGAALAHGAGVVFAADDWEESLRVARAAGTILFVDVWAPWCHTCWSMKRDVLHDPSLAAFTGRVTFVEVDGDKPDNAAFMARYPVRVWPTFFAIDSASGSILAAHGGSMSLAETRAFLERALAARTGGNAVDQLLAGAYATLQSGDARGAALRFVEAGALPGPRREEALTAAVRALREAKDFVRCAEVATASLDTLTGSAAAGDTAGMALTCASELTDADPAHAAARNAARAAAQHTLERLLAAPGAGASVDDRADHMATLAGLYDDTGRAADARALHERRLKLLEEDARASDPVAARVHDYARMNSYIALGRGDEAVALFRARAAQLPDDYEAHARLAAALQHMKRLDEAAPVAERAVALAYGPRKLRYLRMLADIHGARADAAGEVRALKRLLAENAALPPVMQKPEIALAAQARLASLALDADGAGPPKR